jgi:hypothetical protein
VPRMPKAERIRIQRQCLWYIERTSSLEAARKLAKKDGFTQNECHWIAAFGMSLDRDTDWKSLAPGED